MYKAAKFSDDRKYRYSLTRVWDFELGAVAFIGLNPSTADETNDDPTVRRCINYARDWGYGAMVMLNIFAFRATDPKVMMAEESPIGPDNDRIISLVSRNASLTVAAWGIHGKYLGRGDGVMGILHEPHYLKLTKDGHPGHPLYLKKDLLPVRY